MPFSSLRDPVDLARAEGALLAAWVEIQLAAPTPLCELDRIRLAYIIAALSNVAEDEDSHGSDKPRSPDVGFANGAGLLRCFGSPLLVA